MNFHNINNYLWNISYLTNSLILLKSRTFCQYKTDKYISKTCLIFTYFLIFQSFFMGKFLFSRFIYFLLFTTYWWIKGLRFNKPFYLFPLRLLYPWKSSVHLRLQFQFNFSKPLCILNSYNCTFCRQESFVSLKQLSGYLNRKFYYIFSLCLRIDGI